MRVVVAFEVVVARELVAREAVVMEMGSGRWAGKGEVARAWEIWVAVATATEDMVVGTVAEGGWETMVAPWEKVVVARELVAAGKAAATKAVEAVVMETVVAAWATVAVVREPGLQVGAARAREKVVDGTARAVGAARVVADTVREAGTARAAVAMVWDPAGVTRGLAATCMVAGTPLQGGRWTGWR